MILYVDLEHEQFYSGETQLVEAFELDTNMRYMCTAATLITKYRFEELTGERCLIVHYRHISPELVRELGAKAVFLSGHFTDFEHYDEDHYAGLKRLMHEVPCPTLGVCAAQQLMARFYGVEIGPMGPLPFTVADPGVGTPSQGRKQERGWTPVRLHQPHPLLEGLGDEALIFSLHLWEAKSLPAEFELLGETDMSRIQIMAHKEKPLFSTVFHPERYDETHLDGKRMLQNFFRIAENIE
jgi:GMP synthase-like glutamine amidotransferase